VKAQRSVEAAESILAGQPRRFAMEAVNLITEKIIRCAIEVHRNLGPGLLESIYEAALCVEFDAAGIQYRRQVAYPVIYKGQEIGQHRIDLIVEDTVIVELKSVERMDPIFEAQLLSYLKLTGKHVGLLINFNETLLKRGIKRLVL
jgi:GxxExxY protein